MCPCFTKIEVLEIRVAYKSGLGRAHKQGSRPSALLFSLFPFSPLFLSSSLGQEKDDLLTLE